MLRELHQNINNPKYNCIAHIHTHPYIGGTCRFFSNQDLRTIRSLQDGFQPSDGRKVYFLGGLLTVGKGNNPDDDEISFVFHDDNHGWYKVTNITVMQNNTEIPFARTNNRTKMREI